MRTIKFRVWDRTNKSMSRPCNLFSYPIWDYGNGVVTKTELINCEVMQFTGLLDKNGKEIYEGDILGGLWGAKIAWCETQGCFELWFEDESCMACSGDVHWVDVVEDNGKLEVIGNIYENPDLLKASESNAQP